jgi:hypothetical protein
MSSSKVERKIKRFDTKFKYLERVIEKRTPNLYKTVKKLYLKNIIDSKTANYLFYDITFQHGNSKKYKMAILELNKYVQEYKDTKNKKQTKIIIKVDDLLNNTYDWWIHQKQIQKMMKEEPNTFITHSVSFYENNKQIGRTIKFNFPTVLDIEDIKEKIMYELFLGSSGEWIVRSFIFNKRYSDDIGFIDDMEIVSEKPEIVDNRKVIITTTSYKKLPDVNRQIQLTQNFKLNDTGDCVYKGLIQFFTPYGENKKRSNGKRILTKLIKNKKRYSKAYTIEQLHKLAQDINCSFTIKDLINDGSDDIEINKTLTNYYNIVFINTKYNHLDVKLCFNNQPEEITKEEYEEIKKEESFYIEKFNYLMTIDKKYKVKDDDFKVVFDQWKEKYNINRCKIPIKSQAYDFINQYDDKIHRFFNEELPIDNNLYEEIDIKKAFFNYFECDEYIGLPSGSFICVNGDGFNIDTFNKQYKNKIVGFYEVEIIFNNRPDLEYFGFVSGQKYILFSSMVKLLSEIVEFKFINYCVSPSIDMRFDDKFKMVIIDGNMWDAEHAKEDEELKNKVGIKAYSKAVGCLMIDNLTSSINIKPLDNDVDFYKTLTNKNIYKVDDVFKVVETLENPTSLKHLAFGIKAYTQTIILKQMLNMNYKDILGVKVDSIVYKKDSIYNIVPTYKDLFKEPSKANIEVMLLKKGGETYKQKDYGLDDGLEDKHIICDYGLEFTTDDTIHYSYFVKYFQLSKNLIIFDKSPLPNCEHITSILIFCGGAGGTGKTHNLLSSNIFMRNKILFSSNCWELIQDKVNEFNVFGLSLPKLTGEMGEIKTEKIDIDFIKYKVIDELTLINKSVIDKIIQDDNGRSFLFLLGDIDYSGKFYQCSITKDIFNPSKYENLQYIKYTKTYRFNEELNNKVRELRNIMKENNNTLTVYNKFKNLFESSFCKKEDVIINKEDIGISALQPIENGKCKYSDYFYNRNSPKQYYIKNTNFKGGLYKGAKLKESELTGHNYVCSLFRTIHSYQGRQLTHTNKIVILLNSIFDINLFYTAISRARRLDQIIIIDDVKLNNKQQIYLNYSRQKEAPQFEEEPEEYNDKYIKYLEGIEERINTLNTPKELSKDEQDYQIKLNKERIKKYKYIERRNESIKKEEIIDKLAEEAHNKMLEEMNEFNNQNSIDEQHREYLKFHAFDSYMNQLTAIYKKE